MQKMLVANIAEYEWRRRRGRFAERGEILKQSNMSYARHAVSIVEAYGMPYDQPSPQALTTKLDPTEICFELTKQLTLFKQAREQVVERGYVGSTVQKALDTYFGKNADFPMQCYEISRSAEHLQSSEKSGSSDPELELEVARLGERHGGQRFDAEFCKQTLLGLIDNRIEALRARFRSDCAGQ